MPAGSTAGRGSEILLSGMVAEKLAAEKRNIGAKTWQRNEPSPEVEEGWGSSFPEGMTIGKARGNSDESLPGSSRDASVPGINETRRRHAQRRCGASQVVSWTLAFTSSVMWSHWGFWTVWWSWFGRVPSSHILLPEAVRDFIHYNVLVPPGFC